MRMVKSVSRAWGDGVEAVTEASKAVTANIRCSAIMVGLAAQQNHTNQHDAAQTKQKK